MNKCCKNCIFWKFDCTGFVDLDDFCDDYYPSQNAIRPTPVPGDGAEADAGDIEGATRPAPEHDG